MTQKNVTQNFATNDHDPIIAAEIDRYVKALRLEHYVDERGILQPRGQSIDCLMRCSKDSIDFAAEKFKEILSALKARGCEVEFQSKHENRYERPTQKVVVKLGQSSQVLRIEEAATRRERSLTASERKEKERCEVTGSYFYIHKRWIYTPTAKPKLVFDRWSSRAITRDVRPLVDMVIDMLNDSNERKRQNEIDRRHDRAQFLVKLRKFRRKLWKERQFEAIEKEAKSWARAEKLRGYIARVEQEQDDYEVNEWLALAKKLVDDLDPISSVKFAMIVDLPKYAEVEAIWHLRHKTYY